MNLFWSEAVKTKKKKMNEAKLKNIEPLFKRVPIQFRVYFLVFIWIWKADGRIS